MKVRKIASRILHHLGLEKSELSIVLCDNAFSHELNLQWRQKDTPTDVLSFPGASVEEIQRHRQAPDVIPLVLGDVVINLEIVHERVGAGFDSEIQEIQRLLVHGVVHLIGHDHETDAEAARMERVEREILSALTETIGNT